SVQYTPSDHRQDWGKHDQSQKWWFRELARPLPVFLLLPEIILGNTHHLIIAKYRKDLRMQNNRPDATTGCDNVLRHDGVSFYAAFLFWLKLGFISFGGPAGQIAIMHDELVERR